MQSMPSCFSVGHYAHLGVDKKMMQRLEEVENLSKTDKDKILDFIDLIIRDAKTRQAYQ